MLVYRAFLHRLSRFPGPFFARLSNFYVTVLSGKKLQLCDEIQKLHHQYGDYVRVGPTEISIIDPAAIKVIHGATSKFEKGPWYTIIEPRTSLQTDRNKQTHAQRRKAWDRGFSTRALRDYEPRITLYTDQLIAGIEKHVGSPMNMTPWFNYYSFDVMGDMAFGHSFDMLVTGEDSYILRQVHDDMKKIGLFSHLTWLFPFVKRIPGVNKDYLRLWNWVTSHVLHRIQNPPEIPDVFSWILKAFDDGPKAEQDHLNLQGDAYLIIVAGSDTTAAALTNILFHLVKNQALYKELQTELESYLPELSYVKLTSSKLLDAVINETLRLHPAVPSGVQRVTPAEGIKIGETYIPGNTMRLFPRPDEFLPERWTTQPELVNDPSVFIPFYTGPYSCVGKQLALMELRRVTAEIVIRYDVSFAEEQTETAFLNGYRDTFTTVPAPLKVVFTKRGESNLEVS
ncbi:Cytochrome P450 [Penicillium antarcticum]|uniref:Cytochrome P450 n=1 Tax=Penicillium antarcticum TaxID=416450 RepID=UPI0023857D96|nr:Cytochrome P450 [Penicillium antarcticum]KAJ5308716.1 Cytochrome P450 [Penicillium antarcticum]